jgi:hypothetical protein
MKQNEIRYAGKQVFANQDELEEGYVEIIINVKDILDELDNEDIEEYARYYLDMLHEDDFESDLGDFSESELVDHLRDGWFDFTEEVGEEELIDFLERRGYIISGDGVSSSEYDYVDNCLFDDITEKFDSLDCAKRAELRDLVVNYDR